MMYPRDTLFDQAATALGYRFDGEILVGGNYASLVQHGDLMYLSGQVPRVGTDMVATGRVGEQLTLAEAQRAAKVCVMRALAIMRKHLGSLDRVQQVLRVTVYVQCDANFTQQSEVADGASELLHTILGEAGRHSRTSVGVLQLPKNACVEIDMMAAVAPLPERY